MRFAICDDDIYFCNILEKYLQEYFSSRKLPCPEIAVFHSGEEILDYKGSLDIVFIDVEMSGISGIHAGKELCKRDTGTLYIVITAFEEYLDEALHFHAFRYLSKPLEKQRLFRNLKDALAVHASRNEKIAITTKDSIYTVLASDIIMIEAKGKNVFVYTLQDIYPSTEKMDYWEEILNSQCFFRTHRSYIVNMHHINNFNSNLISLYQNKYKAYLTVRKYPDFKRAYMLFLESSQ
ncbi:MAG: LytTR family DNA-binding domain-containing protein [Eubacteriales bacterium]|nr:LytTR family DNA-binding domain-containing protein [Eubacteriales bacterium]